MYEHQILNMARKVQQYLADFKGIQVEPGDIAEPLREHWAEFAVHVWHTEDIFFQAENMALPMSRSLAREILRGIEEVIDCENGITWVTIDDAIQRGTENINWSELSDAEMAAFSGNFVLAWETPSRRLRRCRPVVGSLLDAVQGARGIVRRSIMQVRVLATEPWLEDDPDGAVEVGNELLTITPDASSPSDDSPPLQGAQESDRHLTASAVG
ncbi:MAG: hypothetical protein ISS57_11610 [Anaerolineales bacterium]|nr:hypothetical protein [Anaerolineales bacterium]